ncbi:hypothetical protein RRG08_001254 [Elysia crispata]|uniref:Uncharacterized protein n=1 Tax=Elysia crispata TaxID=231223 RepID=A0AAE1B711_9GAST|nr:hypothetical protein RRG08_001254 [Elysia crispata]
MLALGDLPSSSNLDVSGQRRPHLVNRPVLRPFHRQHRSIREVLVRMAGESSIKLTSILAFIEALAGFSEFVKTLVSLTQYRHPRCSV